MFLSQHQERNWVKTKMARMNILTWLATKYLKCVGSITWQQTNMQILLAVPKKLCCGHRHIHRILSYVDEQFLFVLWQHLRHSGGEGDCGCLAICWQISWNHKAGRHMLFMSEDPTLWVHGMLSCTNPGIWKCHMIHKTKMFFGSSRWMPHTCDEDLCLISV